MSARPVAEGAPAPDGDPLARVSDRAQEYADIWRSAIERNAAGAYKPEDWFDDFNRAWVMAAEDAARAFAAVVDVVAARGVGATAPEEDSSADG